MVVFAGCHMKRPGETLVGCNAVRPSPTPRMRHKLSAFHFDVLSLSISRVIAVFTLTSPGGHAVSVPQHFPAFLEY